MPNTPRDKNPIERVFSRAKAQIAEILPDEEVVVQRGRHTDSYFDHRDPNKANVLNDGPWWENDSIVCRNGATPSAAQVSAALKALQDEQPISESSNTRVFTGTNPIANACNIALRPARKR